MPFLRHDGCPYEYCVFSVYPTCALVTGKPRFPKHRGSVFVCCDELQDIKFAAAMFLIINLIKSLIKEVLVLTDEKFNELFNKFFASLPKYIKSLLGVLCAKVELNN